MPQGSAICSVLNLWYPTIRELYAALAYDTAKMAVRTEDIKWTEYLPIVVHQILRLTKCVKLNWMKSNMCTCRLYR